MRVNIIWAGAGVYARNVINVNADGTPAFCEVEPITKYTSPETIARRGLSEPFYLADAPEGWHISGTMDRDALPVRPNPWVSTRYPEYARYVPYIPDRTYDWSAYEPQ